MLIGIPRETARGERRVALIPPQVAALKKLGLDVCVESGAGLQAGIPDSHFEEKGARMISSHEQLLKDSDVVLMVSAYGANPEGKSGLASMGPGTVTLGFSDPLSAPKAAEETAGLGITSLSMELVPRITRAQSMDALSSMATIAGYKAVLLAANTFPRIFPMLMTAAGTLAPAKVFVIGVGVAGLQAIATARRLGAVVEAYDVRPAVKDQVQSVGAKFVELDLETQASEDAGGYAKAQGEEFYKRQQQQMLEVVARNDIVITTAAIPGKTAPILVTKAMVEAMVPGSVIVDLAAERGGNCEYTQKGETVVEHDVTILGPENLPATIPFHASQMYSKNITTLLLHLLEDGKLNLNMEDEIVASTVVTRDGQVVHPRVREALGLSSSGSAVGSES